MRSDDGKNDARPRVIIVGAGYAGVAAATRFARLLGDAEQAGREMPQIRVTLLDTNPFQTLKTKLHHVVAGSLSAGDVMVDLRPRFADSSVEIVTDTVDEIDLRRGVIRSGSRSYHYDYLLITAGAEPDYFGIPGAREHTLPLWSLEDAISAHRQIEARLREAAQAESAAVRERNQHFVIAGGGLSGVELAGALVEQLPERARNHGLDPAAIRLTLVEMQPRLLPTLPAERGRRAQADLQRRGVHLRLGTRVIAAEACGVSLSDGSEAHAGTVIWTAGINGAELTRRLPLAKNVTLRASSVSEATAEAETGAVGPESAPGQDAAADRSLGIRGRVCVDEHLRSLEQPNVYIAGDVAWYYAEDGVPSQTAASANKTGRTAAENIVAAVRGRPERPCDCLLTS